MRIRRSGLTLSLLICLIGATSTHAATFVVTRADDPAPGACTVTDCSLREAVTAAAATPAEDTIVLGNGLYNVTRGELALTGDLTIEGAGPASTRIVGEGVFSLLRATPLSTLTLTGVQLAGEAVAVFADGGNVLLVDVVVADSETAVGLDAGSGSAWMRIEASRIAGKFICLGASARCSAVDSDLGEVQVSGAQIELTLDRVVVAGATSEFGVAFQSNAAATIRDSTIRNQPTPLAVSSVDGLRGAPVLVQRTRFIGNSGPMFGNRDGMVILDDVEFRDNVVGQEFMTAPAVLVAEAGPEWRINRALFEGNRGGGGGTIDGAVVGVVAGANVVMTNVTFADNTFHAGVTGGIGHAIGVRAGTSDPTLLWIFHATLRRASVLTPTTVGSVLSIRGSAANVRVLNSLVDGTCAISEGGAMVQAVGNIESTGFTCGMNSTTNLLGVPASELDLGSLADHGGFTRTFLPVAGSLLIDAASPTWCPFAFGIDQRRYVRPSRWIGCDVGAVESGAVSDVLFSDGFD